ncbi:MAG: MASE1 domain-containing protein [Steroidobacteraceae bacterium]|jgi:signal transduction histidine kinase|nr:MASE1 domain-containing protein [Steroidobacteraceae bacterium]
MPTDHDPSPLARLPPWATPLVYGALHFAAVAIGLELQVSRPSVAAFWPASGLGLAALLLLPRRHWAGVLLAGVLADLAANAVLRPELAGEGRGLQVALAGAAEALAGAWLVQRVLRGGVDFADVHRTFAFVGLVVATTLGSAALVALPFSGPRFAGDFVENLQAVWIANALGTVIVAPLLLTFGRHGLASAGRASGLPEPEPHATLAAFALLLALLVAVFMRPAAEPRLPIDVPYVVYPALLWIVAIGGTRRVTAAILLTVVFQTVATLNGLGPFGRAGGPAFARAYEVQTFLGLVVLPVLLVSAAVLQLRRAARSLADAEQRYRAFVALSSEVIFRIELEPPVPVSLAPLEQARLIRERAVIAECNAAFLAAQGLAPDKPGIVGSPLREHPTWSDLWLGRAAQWVESGYRLAGVEHRLPGRDTLLLASLAGVVEDGRLVRCWGVAQDVTRIRDTEDAVRRQATQLRRLAGELMTGEERVRRRIAAELHDGPAQMLVAAHLELGMLERAGADGTRDLSGLRQAVEGATAGVRGIMAELSPVGLSEPRIGAGIGELARYFGRTQGITVETGDDGQPKPLDPDSRILLYQCVRELMRNAVKHGQTVWLGVRTRVEDGQIVVEVEDRGAGFEPGTLEALPAQRGGFGLFSVRERVGMLHGSMRIRSSPGSGTLVTLTLPMQREAA